MFHIMGRLTKEVKCNQQDWCAAENKSQKPQFIKLCIVWILKTAYLSTISVTISVFEHY